MDTFVDIHGRPVPRVDLAVGETKIVGLKKFSLQPMVEVGVMARNSNIAFSQQCVHLAMLPRKNILTFTTWQNSRQTMFRLSLMRKISFWPLVAV